MDYFPTADDNRSSARNNLIIYNEVVGIQKAILIATNAGKYSCTVSNTTMTSSSTGAPYFDVVSTGGTTLSDTDAISDQITTVANYFINLGYTVSKTINSNSTFSWLVQW